MLRPPGSTKSRVGRLRMAPGRAWADLDSRRPVRIRARMGTARSNQFNAEENSSRLRGILQSTGRGLTDGRIPSAAGPSESWLAIRGGRRARRRSMGRLGRISQKHDLSLRRWWLFQRKNKIAQHSRATRIDQRTWMPRCKQTKQVPYRLSSPARKKGGGREVLARILPAPPPTGARLRKSGRGPRQSPDVRQGAAGVKW